MGLSGVRPPPGFYHRLWTPVITLWYLTWQCLHERHTLENAVIDARRGGADRLCVKGKRLSEALRSKATTSYSDARQRLPLHWVVECFGKMAAALLGLTQGAGEPLPIRLLDGSTKRLRPYGTVPEQFPAHRTKRQRPYWCVARVVVSFCALTGIAAAARIAALPVSEQALAVQLILEQAQRLLYIGDRNFGVWRVVRAAVQSGGHALVRLTEVRARHLLGVHRLPARLDQLLVWSPTRHDQVDGGLLRAPIAGRLLILKTNRRGFRPQSLYLFTTLTDPQAYPPRKLLELYGRRWQVELDFRTIKSSMGMAQSEAKTPDMVRKEFYAGLMAYNLVRGLMALAAEQGACSAPELSFTKIHALLASALTELFMSWMSGTACRNRLEWLLQEAAAAKLPRRRKPRPNELRAQYYKPQSYPKMTRSREQARQLLVNATHKS